MAEAGIDLSPGAEADLRDAVDFLWERSPTVARDFAQAFEAAVLRLREYPRAGTPIGRRERRFRITGWPYSIIYKLDDSVVVIVALAHASRRPGYWRDRLS